MDEANGSRDRHAKSLLSQLAIFLELGTSTGNLDDDAVVMEYGEQQLTIFTGAATIDSFHRNGSQSPTSLLDLVKNLEIMVSFDEAELHQNPKNLGDNWFSVPISYEQNSLDETMPLANEAKVTRQ